MELTIDQALQQGVAAHKQGKHRDAERFFRAILRAQPNHPDANHNLGVLAVVVGKPLEAVPLLKLALEANPKVEQFWLSYIDVLLKLKRFKDAAHALERAQSFAVCADKLAMFREKMRELPSTHIAPSQDQTDRLLAHYAAGEFTEAVEFASLLIQKFPDYLPGHKVLGAVFKQSGQLVESLWHMEKSVELSPEDAGAHSNLGITLRALGRLAEAEAHHRRAVALSPNSAEAQNNLGNTLKELGNLNDAEKSYALATVLDPNYFNAHRNLSVIRMERGRLKEAEKSSRKALSLSPNCAEAHYNLGVVLQKLGRSTEAEASFLRTIELQPEYAKAHDYLGISLQEQGRLEEAALSHGMAVSLKSDDAEANFNLGIVLQKLGRLDDAVGAYRQAIVLQANYIEAYNNLGNTLAELNKLKEAEASLRQAIKLAPIDAECHYNLGATLERAGRLEEAEASYRRAIELKPNHAAAYNNMGVVLTELGKLDAADASFRRAIELKPDLAEAHNNLGNTLKGLGRERDARASCIQAIKLEPEYAEAHHNLSTIKVYLSEDKQFSQMLRLYQNPSLSEDDRCHICFALAKAYDDMKKFTSAFQYYVEGNALRKKKLRYDGAKDVELFKKFKVNHERLVANSLQPPQEAPKHTPIFIIGMPRSGTTLVEQIVSSHPLVAGAGELPFIAQFGGQLATSQNSLDAGALKSFRDLYCSALQNHSNGKPFVTDKTPQNFRFLGLIAAALPEAKIVHVKRDRSAVCWANYTQYFGNDALNYCYSLEDILRYHSLYEDLMEYFHNKHTGLIHEVIYERLTKHQETETRKLIDYLGLGWDATCLSPQENKRWVGTASSMQVRREVYQGSSERWKHYRPFLNGALDHFASASK